MPRRAVKQEDVSCDPMSILDLCSRYRPLVLRLYFISALLFMCPLSPLGPTTRLPRRVDAGCGDARGRVSRRHLPACRETDWIHRITDDRFGDSCAPGQDKRPPHVRLGRVPHSPMGRGFARGVGGRMLTLDRHRHEKYGAGVRQSNRGSRSCGRGVGGVWRILLASVGRREPHGPVIAVSRKAKTPVSRGLVDNH